MKKSSKKPSPAKKKSKKSSKPSHKPKKINAKKHLSKEAGKKMATHNKKKAAPKKHSPSKPMRSKKAKPMRAQKTKTKTGSSSSQISQSAPVLMRSPRVSQVVQASLNEIKNELNLSETRQAEEIAQKKPPMVLDKVYLQSMSFEMASMRQALDRIGRQLDKLEKELSAHRNSGDDD
jgi:hypothetical protein